MEQRTDQIGEQDPTYFIFIDNSDINMKKHVGWSNVSGRKLDNLDQLIYEHIKTNND